jgi:hypothetical protein
MGVVIGPAHARVAAQYSGCCQAAGEPLGIFGAIVALRHAKGKASLGLGAQNNTYGNFRLNPFVVLGICETRSQVNHGVQIDSLPIWPHKMHRVGLDEVSGTLSTRTRHISPYPSPFAPRPQQALAAQGAPNTRERNSHTKFPEVKMQYRGAPAQRPAQNTDLVHRP